jgi:phage-related protein
MRIVRLGRAVWHVLAIADELGHSLWDELRAADPSDSAAEQMRATLAIDVPRNGPPLMNKTRCRALGGGIYEFKEPGLRVLWFYDTGRRIVCTHACPKLPKKKLQKEMAKARRIRQDYVVAKKEGRLLEPKV